MLRYLTEKTITENAARVETVMFYPQTGDVEVTFSKGHISESDEWTELSRHVHMISRASVPAEMDPHAAAVVGWVYLHLQEIGLLPLT